MDLDTSPPPPVARPASPTLEGLRDSGEANHLGPGGTPQLLHLENGSAGSAAIVFIHGFTGDPANQAAMVKEAHARKMDIWVMVYDTLGKSVEANSEGFAAELMRLGASGPLDVTIVAHSLGAVTLKAALDRLTSARIPIPFQHLRVVAVSTPWQGLKGADCVLALLGAHRSPPLVRDFAAHGANIQRLLSRPWPSDVRFEDVVGSRDPVRWLEVGPADKPFTFGRARRVIEGASHNTALWDHRTLAHVFEDPRLALHGDSAPSLWRTLVEESAAVLGLPGAFEPR